MASESTYDERRKALMRRRVFKCWSCGKVKKRTKFSVEEIMRTDFQSPFCKKCLKRKEKRIEQYSKNGWPE